MLTSLCWGTVMGTSLSDLIPIAAMAGYGGVTITPQMYFDARRNGASDAGLRHSLEDAGIKVTLLDPLMSVLPGSPDPATVGRTFRSLFEATEQQCFEVAEALSIPCVNVAHYLAHPAPFDEIVDAFAGLCDRASDRGLRVLLEFMPEGAVTDLSVALDIVRAAQAPNAAVMLDTWHFYRTGGIVDDLRRCSPGEIGGLQLSDATSTVVHDAHPGLNARLLPGLGAIPLPEIVGWVLASSCEPFFGVEVFDTELSAGAPEDVAATASRSMADLLRSIAPKA